MDQQRYGCNKSVLMKYTFVEYSRYGYRDEYRIKTASLGILLNRLKNHIIDIQSNRFRHNDDYKDLVDIYLDPMFKSFENLFKFGNENTKEYDMINKIFESRSKFSHHEKREHYIQTRNSYEDFESFKSHYKLGRRYITSTNDADILLIALIDAIYERINYFAHNCFGPINDRKYHGYNDFGINLTFKQLDKVYNEVIQTSKAVKHMLQSLIEWYADKEKLNT